jgi:hypothetical protein
LLLLTLGVGGNNICKEFGAIKWITRNYSLLFPILC